MAINKVQYGGETLIDLTSDTVTADTLLEGVTAHNAQGERIVGDKQYKIVTSATAPTVNDPSIITLVVG